MQDSKKLSYFFLLLLPAILLTTAFSFSATQKVILDTDMVELYDDGIAMIMLANSPEIELLGVANVSGNTWVEEGISYTLRQLEIIGKTGVPVFSGARHPFRPGRYENMKLEREMFGELAWIGSFGRPEPESYLKLAPERVPYGGYPSLKPGEMHGVNFIIETIKANPGEVTVLAIGPLTNIALAIMMNPEIVGMVKKIVYLGGAFDVPGNMTPAAEFNWWFDPEAAKICLRAPFKEQIVVGLDVCNKYKFDIKKFQRIIAVDKPLTRFFKHKYGPVFQKDKDYTRLVWDTIAAAIVINPKLITEEEIRWIDVNDDFNADYGRSHGYKDHGPVGTQKGRVIFSIDEKAFWDLMIKLVTF